MTVRKKERGRVREEGSIVSDYCRYCEVQTCGEEGRREENGDGGE